MEALPGAADPALPARLPAHLLLLPQGLLPGVLLVAPGLRGAGTPAPAISGESRFPLILQNVHRLFFYLVLPFPVLLLWDAIRAFDFPDGFGMGVGTLVLLVNAVLLGSYMLSCHSCRHVCGGRIDCLSENPVRYGLWKFLTRLNERHMLIAWVSLVGVAATDVYIRLVATGTIRDLRFF